MSYLNISKEKYTFIQAKNKNYYGSKKYLNENLMSKVVDSDIV